MMRPWLASISLFLGFALSAWGDGLPPASVPNLVSGKTFFGTQVSLGMDEKANYDQICEGQKSVWMSRLRNAQLISLDCHVADSVVIEGDRHMAWGTLSFVVTLNFPISRQPISEKVGEEMGYLTDQVETAITDGYQRWGGSPGYVLERWDTPRGDDQAFPEKLTGEVWLAQ
jgi:hypothetical protein